MKPQLTHYLVRDNSGIKKCYSINFELLLSRYGLIKARLTEVAGNKKLQKGDLTRLAAVGHRRWVSRRSSINTRLGYNLAVGIKKDNTPTASRLFGVCYLEARYTGFMRLAVLSRGLL